MADRHHGYDVSVGYTASFFREMTPGWLDFCIRAQGFDARGIGPSYRYLDLGCGQGFHLCLLAAANPQADFVGIDFQSEHIAHGQDLAAAAGLPNVTFIEADFLDLATAWPKELGSFDYVALQGILSWISPELRAAVLECVAHASKPGTVASFGYNTPPGWLGAVPFQHVANRFRKDCGADAALDGAIAMFRRLADAKAQLFEHLPRFKAHLEQLAAQPRSYLAHEVLTDHWTPLWHSTVAHELRSAGFGFVGSATIADALLPGALPTELGAVIAEQVDDSFRQDVQDIVIAQPFRRDIFRRGPLPSDKDEQLADDAPVHLCFAPQEGAPVRFRTTFGGLTVDYAVVADILDALADGPRPYSELMALKNPLRADTRSILLSMLHVHMLAIGAGQGSAEVTQRFNAAVARAAASGKDYHYVAASALGSAIPVTDVQLLMLDTWLSAGRNMERAGLVKGVVQRLRKGGRQLQARGGPLTDERLSAQIAGPAATFIDQVLPLWRRLGVVE